MAQEDNQGNRFLSRSEATREYTLDASRLDPLANWIKSRQTIDNVFEDEFTNYNLDGEDPNLEFQTIPGFADTQAVYTIRGEDELLGFMKAVNPQLQNQEGLKYMYQGELPPGSQERSNFFNYYVYKNPAQGLNDQQLEYKSFAADILNNILNTTDHIFSSTKENDNFRLRQVPMERVLILFNTLISLLGSLPLRNAEPPYDVGPLSPDFWRLRINDAYQGRLTVRTDRNVIYRRSSAYSLIYGVIDQALADGIQETTLFVIKQVLLRGLVQADIIDEHRLFNTITLLSEYEFNKDETKVVTPYVKNIENSSFLSRSPVNSATLSSKYNFYNEQYERAIEEKSPSDNVLPNLYVRKFLGQSVGAGVPQNLRPSQDARIDQYSSLLRLSNSRQIITDTFGESFYQQLYQSMVSGNSERFYNLYTQILSSPLVISDNIKEKNGKFLMGLKDARRPGGAFGNAGAALSLDLKFIGEGNETGNGIVKDYQDYVLNNEVGDSTIASLENISNYDSQAQPNLSDSYLYSTEYLYDSTTKKTTAQAVQLRKYDIDQGVDSYIFDNVPEQYSSTILQNRPLIPNQDQMASAKQFLLRNAIRRSRSSYQGIIYNHFNTKSEVLGYKITKNRAGSREASQNIFVGNADGATIYRDSQVIYGTEYDYSLTEYRFLYDTPYNLYTISLDMPLSIMIYYLGFGIPGYENIEEFFEDRLVDQSFRLKGMRSCGSNVKLVQVPIYDPDWNRINVFQKIPTTESNEDRAVLVELSNQGKGAGGISYPRLSVMDFPPTAPTLQFFPRLNHDDVIMMNINLESGRLGDIIPDDGTFNETLEIVRIGDNNNIIDRTQNNQRTRFDIPEDRMFFANKGASQIRNIILYRTPDLNLRVEKYNDLYKSFNPAGVNDVLVRKFTTSEYQASENNDLSFILSYDITDNISPNVDYYYTCIAQDVHGQISNPSVIYRIKLVSENGMVIPEISTVVPMGTSNQMADKNLGRFVRIDASNIQTFPYLQNRDGATISARSLASVLGDSIEEDAYIVRFTSKDTGRKFDLKLKFVVKVDGRGINE